MPKKGRPRKGLVLAVTGRYVTFSDQLPGGGGNSAKDTRQEELLVHPTGDRE